MQSPFRLKPMIHGSTSFNFCWSTNVEHCCDLLKCCCNLLNTHSTFVEQQQHFGAKLKWWTRKCCCRFALRALSPLSWSGDKKDVKTAKFKFKFKSKFCCNLCQCFISHVTVFVIFDVIAYRHGKVSYRLISWLVLSKLHSNSNSADSNSSAAVLIATKPRDTKLEKQLV